MFRFEANLPLSLYVHFPWCQSKCPYCDFNSHQVSSSADFENYLKLLEQDLIRFLPFIWGRKIVSIFIGGGTPSLLSGKQIYTLLSKIRALLSLNTNLEITLEANPGTLDIKNFAAYHDAQVNRLSIGVQSFDDKMLKHIGRLHTAKDACKAIEAAQASGFRKINLDIMHSLPEQMDTMAIKDLKTAINYGVRHISHYELTLEPNTVFFRSPPKATKVSEEFCDEALELLTSHGFNQYEVSAYATADEHQSQHNLNYWRFGDYLGIGAGAHSKLTMVAEGKIFRHENPRLPSAYQKFIEDIKLSPDNKEWENKAFKSLTEKQVIFEFALNVLRLKQGAPIDSFAFYTGLCASYLYPYILKAQARGLLSREINVFRASELGWRHLNELQTIFLDDK